MSLREKIINSVNVALDDAEKTWKKVGHHFITDEIKKSMSVLAEAREVPSQIPGFPILKENKPEVANFIAFVLDIRDSTNHLLQAISHKYAKASQLERVLYETTAINTAGSVIIEHYNGGITEYLGDGFLALFRVENEKDPNEVYDAYNAAQSYLSTALVEVNEILDNRYSLPELKVGIGMAYSKSIVTIVGTGNNLHPKAIGECVYRATKLSNGTNEVLIDDRLELLWPTSDDGKLKFYLLSSRNLDFNSYRILKK